MAKMSGKHKDRLSNLEMQLEVDFVGFAIYKGFNCLCNFMGKSDQKHPDLDNLQCLAKVG